MLEYLIARMLEYLIARILELSLTKVLFSVKKFRKKKIQDNTKQKTNYSTNKMSEMY